MFFLQMVFRSMISYTAFLASRKIIKGTTGIVGSLQKSFELHRCVNCWRLYSGVIEHCDYCSSYVKPLYQIYDEMQDGYQENDMESREGLDRKIYNDTKHYKFKPLKRRTLEVNNDRRTSAEPSRGYQRRDRECLGHVTDYRAVSTGNG